MSTAVILEIVILAGVAFYIVSKYLSIIGKGEQVKKRANSQSSQATIQNDASKVISLLPKTKNNDNKSTTEDQQTLDLSKPLSMKQKIDYITTKENGFHIKTFIKNSQLVFKQILETNKLSEVKTLVTTDIFELIKSSHQSTLNNGTKRKILSFNYSDIISIAIKDKIVQIKLEVVSEQLHKLTNNTHKRLRFTDYVTFEKKLGSKSPVWKICELGSPHYSTN